MDIIMTIYIEMINTRCITMCKELDNINKATLTSYIQFLKEANLIYISDQQRCKHRKVNNCYGS